MDKIPQEYEIPLYLFHNGTNYETYRFLGCHKGTKDGNDGYYFRVWAAKARAVSLVGDFNNWDDNATPMQQIEKSEVWEVFIPGLKTYDTYKFSIVGCDGKRRCKADPYGTHMELKPQTGSKIFDIEGYKWKDDKWQEERKTKDVYNCPMNIYEVHLNSWKSCDDGVYYSYTKFANTIIPYLKDMGYTHIEFMPLAEFPFDGSWGYQGIGYYAPTSRFGTPHEFMAMIDLFHQAGISVILDWVPAHFPRDEAGLFEFDGGASYEYADPKKRDHLAWGTRVFDYGRGEVKSFLISNALYWIEQYHIDGLRVDAVASMLYLDYDRRDGEWTPNIYGGHENLEAVQFLRDLNTAVFSRCPTALMIAEESTAWPMVTKPVTDGGLGFNFKWNMGWMNDSLEYLQLDPIYRQYHHNEMTFAMVYAYSENYILPISHDEVVHGKGSMVNKVPQDDWRKFSTLRTFYSFMWAFPGKQLLFMGQEFGERAEWNEEAGLEWWVDGLQWHRGLRDMMREINLVQAATPALYERDCEPDGFSWINANDWMANTFSWLRYGADHDREIVACVANFSPEPYEQYAIRVPRPGVWREILNTSDTRWDGDGGYENGTLTTFVGEDGTDQLMVRIPPLAGLWLAYDPVASAEQA